MSYQCLGFWPNVGPVVAQPLFSNAGGGSDVESPRSVISVGFNYQLRCFMSSIMATMARCGSCSQANSFSKRLQWCKQNPANTRHWPNVGLMLGQRRRRWNNISPTLSQHLVFVWKICPNIFSLVGQRRWVMRQRWCGASCLLGACDIHRLTLVAVSDCYISNTDFQVSNYCEISSII